MNTMMIILIILLVVVIAFVIITTITGRKANKKEKAQRYQQVRDKIKVYISKQESKRNLRIEFEKVFARKGAEYKYRDVFDVIVELIEPKTQKLIEVRAYEIEGITTKIDKKNFNTDWVVNCPLDLEETKRRIAIGEKKIKLTRDEKATLKKDERLKEKEMIALEKETAKKQKDKIKEAKAAPTPVKAELNKDNKFVPTRSKN